MRTLITGGYGFVGHHVVEHLLKNTSDELIIFDKLTYAASGYDRLREIEAFDDKRVQIFPIDLTQPISEGVVKEIGKIGYIITKITEVQRESGVYMQYKQYWIRPRGEGIHQ